MSACAAYGCKNTPHNTLSGINFHKFPKDITLRNKWISALRRLNFRPTKYSRMCSEHFSVDQIYLTSLASVCLKENAVPNIFKEYPNYLQEKLIQLTSTGKESMLSRKRKYNGEDEDSSSDEDCSSDEELKDAEESISSSENKEQITSSDNFLNDKICTSESSKDCNKNGLTSDPTILRLNPHRVSNKKRKLLSAIRRLNPHPIDALSSSCQVEDSSMPPDSTDAVRSEFLLLSKISNDIYLQRQMQELEFFSIPSM